MMKKLEGRAFGKPPTRAEDTLLLVLSSGQSLTLLDGQALHGHTLILTAQCEKILSAHTYVRPHCVTIQMFVQTHTLHNSSSEEQPVMRLCMLVHVSEPPLSCQIRFPVRSHFIQSVYLIRISFRQFQVIYK